MTDMAPLPVPAATAAPAVAPESLAAERRLPSRRILCSRPLAWRSLLLRAYDDPDEADGFTTASTPDLLVVLNVSGEFTIESHHARGITRARYGAGSVGITAPLASATLAWRSEPSEPRRSVHIHLSSLLLAETAAALGRASAISGLSDGLLVEDPVLTTLALGLWDAARRDAPGLQADALAQAMALHVVYGRSLTADLVQPAHGQGLSPPTLARVIDYMDAHLDRAIALEELAMIASLSRYHFLRLFSRSTGITPHRYLARMRVQRAARLLRSTDDTVAVIANACGYRSPRQFAEAFRRIFGRSPSAFRRDARG